jgi:hypothetical protein
MTRAGSNMRGFGPPRSRTNPRVGTDILIVWSISAGFVVRKFVGSAVSVVRFWMDLELDCPDRRVTVKKRTSDPMHSVDHSTIDAEDDRIRRVNFLDKPNVLYHFSDGGDLGAAIEPIVSVHVRDGLQRNLPDWEISAQADQSVDVPSVEPIFSRPEVVLLPHGISLTQVQVPGVAVSASARVETLKRAAP